MKLNKISIKKLPGINDSFSIQNICKGVNIIFGSNGSGKTSLCRLVKNSLWENNKKILEETNASLIWDNEASTYNTNIFGNVKWTSDTGNTSPDIPESNLADCFHISIAEMFDSKNRTEQEIAKKIYIEMTGGCDFKSIKDKYSFTRNTLKNETSEYENLIRRKKKLEYDETLLADQQDSIDKLENEKRESAEAINKLKEIEQIEKYLSLEKELQLITNQITGYPKILNNLTGNELNNLTELNSDILSKEEKVKNLQSQLNVLRGNLKEILLPKDIPKQIAIDETQKLLTSLRTEKTALNNTINEYQASEVKLKAISEDLVKYNIFLKNCECLEPDNLKQLLRVNEKIGALTAEIDILKAKTRSIKTELNILIQEEHNTEKTDRILSLLNKWLSFPETNNAGYKLSGCITLVLTVIFGFLSFFSEHSVFSNSIQEKNWLSNFIISNSNFSYHNISIIINTIAYLSLGFLLTILFIYIINKKLMKPKKPIIEKELFKILELENLDRNTALEKLNVLLNQKTAYEVYRKELLRLNILIKSFEEEIKINNNKINRLIEDLKENQLFKEINKSIIDLEFHDLLNIIDNYRIEYYQNINLREKKNNLSITCDRLISKINDLLQIDIILKTKLFSVFPVADSTLKSNMKDHVSSTTIEYDDSNVLEKMEVSFYTLKNNLQSKKRIESEIKSTEQLLDINLDQLSGGQKRKTALLDKLDLNNVENVELILSKYLEMRPQFQSLLNEERKFDNILQSMSDIKPLKDNYTVNGRESKLTIQAKAEKFEEIIQGIKEIETNIKHAENEQKSTECNQKISDSKYKIDSGVNKILNKLASEFIVEKIEKQYETNNQPEVMQKAIDLFSKFTNNQYRLKIVNSNNIPTFRVFDNNTREYFSLEKLSDGTKIQLFLAVRLAFIKSVEKNTTKLPIFFDEVLSNTDSDRFYEIVKTLFLIAKEDDRQIFYLTSDINDVSKFNKIVNDSSDNLIKIFDLGEIRKISSSNNDLNLPQIENVQIPKPESHTAKKYASILKVPTFNHYDDINDCHLFYILDDDLKSLYILLSKLKVKKLGECSYLFEANSNMCRKVLTDEKFNLIKMRILILTIYQTEWLKGRSKPITDHTVLNNFKLNPKYLNTLRNILIDNNNNTDVFIETLKNSSDSGLKGFRNSKKTEIIDFFNDNGYTSNDEILETYKIRSNVYKSLEASTFKNIFSNKKGLTEINRVSSMF